MIGITRLSGGPAALLAMALTSVTATAANAAPMQARKSAAKKEPAACAALHKEYGLVGKRLAIAKVRGDLGGAAAKLRAEQEAASVQGQARTTLDLLKGNGCKMPTSAPNRDAYLSHALTCFEELMTRSGGSVSQPPACVIENWKP